MISKNPPSILLITVDCLRPDHLGCYGYKRPTSPNIDALAKESAVFSQAISQGTYTVSSLTTMVTSSYLFQHRLSEHVLRVELNPSIPTLPEILKGFGYDTAFLGHWMVANIKDFNRGFDYFDLGPSGAGKPWLYFLGGMKRLTAGRFDPGGAESLTSKAIGWIKQRKGRPFFLWLHYFDAHAPYRTRAPYEKMFVGDGLGTFQGRRPFVESRLMGAAGIPSFIADGNNSDLDYYISKYDGAIRYVDTHIGRLTDFLKASRIYNDLSVLLSSDHGEYLGEHDFHFCHGGLPLEPLIRVPLIIKPPSGDPGSSSVVDTQVQSLDIVPTLLSLSGLKYAGQCRGIDISGVFKQEDILEERAAFLWARHIAALRKKGCKLIYLEKDNIIARLEALKTRKAGPKSAKWKTFFPAQLDFLFKDGIPNSIFYDLKIDPSENFPKIDMPAGGSSVQGELDAWKDSISELRSGPGEDFGRDEREKLKNFGYIQ